jgi:solute:Na+ symporter, SSS family
MFSTDDCIFISISKTFFMSGIDWSILIATLLLIIVYGIYKSRGAKNIEAYLLADRQMPWYHVGLSVMATQASAITFLSAPGQGYTDGMRFVQFYFGLPLAMIVLCITFIPKFSKLKVYTAYEFLENRFDVKVRSITAFLFLLQRGLSTGITIYAPAIILSTILHIDIRFTIIFNGLLVMTYTLLGGAKAVSYTQLLQMIIIFSGLFLAFYLLLHKLPANMGFINAMHLAGKLHKLNSIDTTFDIKNKYNIWSGIIGGFFLQLSYFGTDQSQVGRYLTGKSIAQSRLGLIMNGLVKIPMQFFILLIGVLVFVFYQFHTSPLFCNQAEIDKINTSNYQNEYHIIENNFSIAQQQKQVVAYQLAEAIAANNDNKILQKQQELQTVLDSCKAIQAQGVAVMKKNDANADVNDTNYIFLTFITQHMPIGVIGLLIAIIFLAAMGSTASGINSLASTTIVDFYKRFGNHKLNDTTYLQASKVATVLWTFFCIGIAFFANRVGNLIEAVNILGSLFYGVILGIFIVAFYMPSIKSKAVLYSVIVSEIIVLAVWQREVMAFLWLNVVGCLAVVVIAFLLQTFMNIYNKNKAFNIL